MLLNHEKGWDWEMIRSILSEGDSIVPSETELPQYHSIEL